MQLVAEKKSYPASMRSARANFIGTIHLLIFLRETEDSNYIVVSSALLDTYYMSRTTRGSGNYMI